MRKRGQVKAGDGPLANEVAPELPDKRAQVVRDAIVGKLKPFQRMARTLTTDNGKEFALHQQIASRLGLGSYFAHPHAACEHGANENLNGLLRQFFPKHRKLEDVSVSASACWLQLRNMRRQIGGHW